MAIPAHIDTKIDRSADCWSWRGWHAGNGYARATVDEERVAVHRVTYEALVAPIPDGFTLDHLCRNRGCVNPAHLEPVTNRANILRGVVPSANRTLCKNGLHDITTPGSIYVDSEGTARCHECRLETKRRYRARQRVAA